MKKILFLIILFFLAGRGYADAFIVKTYIGDPAGEGIPMCNSLATNPTGCLKNDFNVVTLGIGEYVPTDDFKRVIYRILWETSRSSAYRENLMSGGTLEIYIKKCDTSTCISHVSGDITLNIRSNYLVYSAGLKRLLVHESGHVLRRRASQAYNRFDINVAVSQDGPDCYERSFVKSYSLRNYSDSCNGSKDKWNVNPKSESFATAIGNYQFSGSIGGGFMCSKRITNFKTDCSYTYEFMKNNIFGGYEFY